MKKGQIRGIEFYTEGSGVLCSHEIHKPMLDSEFFHFLSSVCHLHQTLEGDWVNFSAVVSKLNSLKTTYPTFWHQIAVDLFLHLIVIVIPTDPFEWYPISKLVGVTGSIWIFVLSISVIDGQTPLLVCFLYHASLLIHFQSLMYCCLASSPIRLCNVLQLPSAWLHLIASVNRT